MSRLIFWIALALLVVLAIRSKLRGAGQGGGSPAGRAQGTEAAGPAGPIESMACCAHCHVYFPVSEAVQADGQVYCSPAHVRQPPL